MWRLSHHFWAFRHKRKGPNKPLEPLISDGCICQILNNLPNKTSLRGAGFNRRPGGFLRK
jgi:hypothetical protein